MKGAQASAWVTYFLLAIGIVIPVVCVVWLVRNVVENENELLGRLLSEANARSLKDAEAEVIALAQRLDAGGDAGSFRFFADTEVVDESESEAARALLTKIRGELAGLAGGESQALIVDRLVDRQAMALRLPNGRSVGPIVVEMGIRRLGSEEALSNRFRDAADTLLVAMERRAGTTGQLRYFARLYAPYSKSKAVAEVAKRQELAEAWLEEIGGDYAVGGDSRMGRTEDFFYRWDVEERVVSVFDIGPLKDRLASIESLESKGIELRVNGAFEPGTEWRRVLGYPLDFVGLGMGKVDRDGGYLSERSQLYVWVGGIVLGLSVLSGVAIAISLKRQSDVAKLKDNLISTVTHELKTPVSSIRLLVDTLQDESRRGKVDEREYVDLIARENQRLGRLIDNFLSFSRMERGMGRFELEPVSAKEIVDATEEAFRDRFQGREFELNVVVEEGISEVLGDFDALATVLGNLLENALKYGDDEGRISLRAKAGEGGVEFEVEDFGVGISKKEQARIFRKFYQVASNRGAHAGSVGLGLSIVDFIVSKHSGQVEVKSELGKGSVFKVRIPYA